MTGGICRLSSIVDQLSQRTAQLGQHKSGSQTSSAPRQGCLHGGSNFVVGVSRPVILGREELGSSVRQIIRKSIDGNGAPMTVNFPAAGIDSDDDDILAIPATEDDAAKRAL